MDVAIVSCQECFFSKNAETQIRGVLDKVITMDKQKMDIKLQSYDLKDLEHSKIAADVHQCKVQIVLISHHFLQRLKLEASTRLRISPIKKVFRSKRVVAILVGGINQDEICESYQTVLAKFGEWFSLELRSTSKLDSEFCKKFTEQVVKIYNLEQCNTSNFSVFPKKVTRDQPKIVVMLKKPLELDDEVRIQFSCGRKMEDSTFSKIENPFTLSVRVPDTLSPERTAYVEVTVFINGHKLGITCIKSDLQGRQSDEDVVERMIKMVPGFVKLFDENVKQTLIKNYRECTDFLTDPAIELMNDVLICKGDEFPTVMHFAAYYGLEHTAFTVLDEADGLEQCKVTNDQGFKALDLAEYRNHDNVVQIIQDFHIHQEISASCQAYQLIKKMYARESVLELSKKEIVSKSRNAQEAPLPSYKNLPEKDVTASKDNNQNSHNFSNQEDHKICNSAGSYITWNVDQINGNGTSEMPTVTITTNSIKKPKPAARSPKLKERRGYEYANVDGQEKTVSESETVEFINVEEHIEEHVRLRHPREGGKNARNPIKRASISPEQRQGLDYDIPRLVNEDYTIPPPESRPVFLEPPQNSNSPVLVKKTHGSIPRDKDGYIFMDSEEHTGTSKKEFIRYQEGTFIAEIWTEAKDLAKNDNKVKENDSSTIKKNSRDDYIPNSGQNEGKVEKKISQSSNGEPAIVLDPVDEELIQLMKDFASSGYTMAQIELLFENWKSRPDVMKSIEEKKNYMKGLREEYKHMQAVQSSKGVSFLAKVKAVIGGKKKTSMTTPPKIEHLASLEELNKEGHHGNSADRESVASHESGSGNSVPDSGVDSEKERPFGSPDSNSPKIYRNPHDRRFCPSYVPPDPPNIPQIAQISTEYQIPPPPRPLTNPPVPKKPARANISHQSESESPGIDPDHTSQKPPVIPSKPSHMRVNDEETPAPPPPPRSNNKPNPFHYIDYSSRSRAEISNKPVVRSPSPYDNVKEDK